MFLECVAGWQAFCACEFSITVNHACISFHSPKAGRILGPQSLQLYCSKRIRGGGERECLWGILVFAFNLELRAVAWETKPKKKKSHFCMHLQIFKWQDVLLCWKEVLKSKGLRRQGLLSAQSTSAYHRYFLSLCLVKLNMQMLKTETKKVKLFSGHVSCEASGSSRKHAAMQSENSFSECTSTGNLHFNWWYELGLCHN